MRFSYIDHQELDGFMISFEKVIETHGPLDKGRSGKAAKDQGHRLFAFEICETNRVLSV
jgi:hypothetical protein